MQTIRPKLFTPAFLFLHKLKYLKMQLWFKSMPAARGPPRSLFSHVDKYRTVDLLPRLPRNRTVRTGSNYFQVRSFTVGSTFPRLDPLKNHTTQRISICKDFDPVAHLFLFTRIGEGRRNQKAKVVFFPQLCQIPRVSKVYSKSTLSACMVLACSTLASHQPGGQIQTRPS